MTTTTDRTGRLFFGWYVVAGTFIAQLFVAGLFVYSASLLVAPVRAEFDASLEQVMYSLTTATLIGLVLQPVAGLMVDRFPLRWLMTAGTVCFALGLYALARCTSLIQYIVIFGLTMSIANCFAGSLCSSAAISRWFTTSRGRALGIAAIGTSAGGICIPPLVNHWIELYGWRGAMENMGWMVALVMLPCVLLWVRGQPSDAGMLAEGGAVADPAAPVVTTGMTLREIIAKGEFWYISLSLGLLFGAFNAVLANLTPYATGLGHSEERGASLIMAVAAAGFLGKLLFGFAADKFSLRAGLWAAQLLVIASLVVLAAQPGYGLMLAGTFLLGLAAGGMLPVWGAMTAQVFGLASFGRAMGFMGPVITLCVLPCFPLIGRLHDTSGSYVLSLYVFAAVTLIAALLLLPLRLQRA